jgi:2,4-dienoyl-CoA reductase-like NADH-dependent reductase (Old Yellow Enzyme family)
MNREEIRALVRMFVEGARRVVEAGIDGIELHSANGYVFTQFISSAINDRNDEYGGSLENRFRFRREVIEGIRAPARAPRPIRPRIPAVRTSAPRCAKRAASSHRKREPNCLPSPIATDARRRALHLRHGLPRE